MTIPHSRSRWGDYVVLAPQEAPGGNARPSGRSPIRRSPLLENDKLARLVRDLALEGPARQCAAHSLRNVAGKGGDISESFPAIRAALQCGDPHTVDHLLWAIRYAKKNGSDVTSLLPAIDELRYSGRTNTRTLAKLAIEQPAER